MPVELAWFIVGLMLGYGAKQEGWLERKRSEKTEGEQS